MVGVTEGVFELVDGLATIIDGQSWWQGRVQFRTSSEHPSSAPRNTAGLLIPTRAWLEGPHQGANGSRCDRMLDDEVPYEPRTMGSRVEVFAARPRLEPQTALTRCRYTDTSSPFAAASAATGASCSRSSHGCRPGRSRHLCCHPRRVDGLGSLVGALDPPLELEASLVGILHGRQLLAVAELDRPFGAPSSSMAIE